MVALPLRGALAFRAEPRKPMGNLILFNGPRAGERGPGRRRLRRRRVARGAARRAVSCSVSVRSDPVALL